MTKEEQMNVREYIEKLEESILRNEASTKELMKAVCDVNDALQKWTIEDFNWKREEVKKRLEFEEKLVPVLEWLESLAGAKRVGALAMKIIASIIGAGASVGGAYLLFKEVFK